MGEGATNLRWFKSSYSHTGDCVELAIDQKQREMHVRNSRDLSQGELIFTFDEWQAFVRGVNDGEADLRL